MKRKLLIAVPLLLLVVLVAWFLRPKHEFLGEAYVGERTATLWSSVAQVREPLDTLHYGDRVDVVARRNDSIKVRTAAGELGWVEGRYLIDPALWQRSTKLLKQVLPMPAQARGRTKVATNLRVAPGRTQARLYQFARGVPVEVVGRSVADWVPVSDEKDSLNEPQDTKREDWFLIRGLATRPPGEATTRAAETTTTQPGDQTLPIAGWVIARFIELDLPDPVRDGASSSNIRPIAWFELNRVSDPRGDKPQYLVAADHPAPARVKDALDAAVHAGLEPDLAAALAGSVRDGSDVRDVKLHSLRRAGLKASPAILRPFASIPGTCEESGTRRPSLKTISAANCLSRLERGQRTSPNFALRKWVVTKKSASIV